MSTIAKGIAYKRDNKPRVTWPVYNETYDDVGNPTGEYTSNLEALIAALPDGTAYTLVSEDEAENWWQTNQAELTLFEQIAEAQAPFIEQQELIKNDFLTARLEGDAELEAEIQAEYQELVQEMEKATQAVKEQST